MSHKFDLIQMCQQGVANWLKTSEKYGYKCADDFIESAQLTLREAYDEFKRIDEKHYQATFSHYFGRKPIVIDMVSTDDGVIEKILDVDTVLEYGRYLDE